MTGFVVLRRGGVTRRIPFWTRVERPQLGGSGQRRCTRRRGATRATRAAGRARVSSYRYPDDPSRRRPLERSSRPGAGVSRAGRSRVANFGVASSPRERASSSRRGSWLRRRREPAGGRSRAARRHQPVPRLVRATRPVSLLSYRRAVSTTSSSTRARAPSPATFSFRLWIERHRRLRARAADTPRLLGTEASSCPSSTAAQASIRGRSGAFVDGRKLTTHVLVRAGARACSAGSSHADGTRSSSRRPTTRRRRTRRAPPGTCPNTSVLRTSFRVR